MTRNPAATIHAAAARLPRAAPSIRCPHCRHAIDVEVRAMSATSVKRCWRCGDSKALRLFGKRAASSDGRAHICKRCDAARKSEAAVRRRTA